MFTHEFAACPGWRGLVLAVIGLAGVPPGVPGDEPTAIVLRRCTTEFASASTLGVASGGLLESLEVKVGDRVEAGRTLARLNDADALAERDRRAAEAAYDGDLRLAEAKRAQVAARLRTAEALGRRNLVSADETAALKVEADAAVGAVEEAKHRRRLAEIGLRQAEQALLGRRIVAPHDGLVVAVFKARGEPVAPTEPILKVVSVDRVRVTGLLDVSLAWKVRAGRPVKVSAEVRGADLPIEAETFVGTILLVDPEVNPETQTCRVVAEVENRDGLLRAGLEARMEILAEAHSPTDPESPKSNK